MRTQEEISKARRRLDAELVTVLVEQRTNREPDPHDHSLKYLFGLGMWLMLMICMLLQLG